jgi:heterodisulfide reductase subunit C
MCSEKCPQKVDPTQAIFAMKNIAAKEIGIPEGLKSFTESIYKFGRSSEVGDFEEEDREILNIPPVPETNVEGVQNTIDTTSLGKMIKS